MTGEADVELTRVSFPFHSSGPVQYSFVQSVNFHGSKLKKQQQKKKKQFSGIVVSARSHCATHFVANFSLKNTLFYMD